jgi:uncharacterized protein (DUF433 family)
VKALSPEDPRVAWPLLTVREAAWNLAVAESTFRDWARGYRRQNGRAQEVVGEPVVTCLPGRRRDASIPLVGLVEGLVLHAFRTTGVPLQRIRPALTVLRQEIGLEHALASKGLYSDGAEVLYDYAHRHGSELGALAESLVVVRSGQYVFVDTIRDYLKLITFAKDGWPDRISLPAYRSAKVIVDPRLAFGRPIFEHGGARVEDVIDRWRAGESAADLANDFGVSAEEIEDAARATSIRAAA